MARKYTPLLQWRCFFNKESIIEVVLSQEFFLGCTGLVLLILSLYPYQKQEHGNISYLLEIQGQLCVTRAKTDAKIIQLSSNISLRPFLFQKIPVNIADSDLIQTISGIGEKTASAIIEERQKNLFFSSSDLTRVHGIGRKTAQKLASYFSFEIPKSVQHYDTN